MLDAIWIWPVKPVQSDMLISKEIVKYAILNVVNVNKITLINVYLVNSGNKIDKTMVIVIA